MSDIAPELPTGIEALQAQLLVARAERDAAIAERDQALSQNDRLRHLLRQLQRAQFGQRSEKLDPDQLLLAIEDTEQVSSAFRRGMVTKQGAALKPLASIAQQQRCWVPRRRLA